VDVGAENSTRSTKCRDSKNLIEAKRRRNSGCKQRIYLRNNPKKKEEGKRRGDTDKKEKSLSLSLKPTICPKPTPKEKLPGKRKRKEKKGHRDIIFSFFR